MPDKIVSGRRVPMSDDEIAGIAEDEARRVRRKAWNIRKDIARINAQLPAVLYSMIDASSPDVAKEWKAMLKALKAEMDAL